MTQRLIAGRARSQATLIGGTILLLILVAVVLPLILQLNQAATSIEEGVRLAAQIKLRATREKVLVQFVYNTSLSPVAANITISSAAILINNTGTVRVVIERVIILNRTSGEPVSSPIICGSNIPCGLINIADANNNPLVANAQPLYDNCLVGILKGGNPANLVCLDNKDEVAVLDPGDVLYISIDPSKVPYLINQTVIYAESAYGVIHPVVTPPPIPGQAPGAGAGVPIPPQAIPRGLYTPITGFILWGYSEIVNYTYTEVVRPPLRVSTLGPIDPNEVCGGIPYALTALYIDYDHPGLFKVLIVPSKTSYIYVYYNGTWTSIKLRAGEEYYIMGFIGTYTTDKPSASSACTESSLVLIDGWAYAIIDGNGNVLISATSNTGLGPLQPSIGEIDLDKNNISELYFATYNASTNSDQDADGTFNPNVNSYELVSVGKLLLPIPSKGANIYRIPNTELYFFSYNDSYVSTKDDALMVAHYLLRDITGVDAIQIAVKINFDWLQTQFGNVGSGYTRLYQEPIAAVGLLKLVKIDNGEYVWRLVYIKTIESANAFRSTEPYTFWVDVLFPVNRTDVYRIVIYTYDPYAWIPLDDSGILDWNALCNSVSGPWGLNLYVCTPPGGLDTIVSIEHIIVQYYIYNPILRKIPVVYLVNITGTPYWPSGVSTA